MINNTNRPILNSAIPPSRLNMHIRNAIGFTMRDETARLRGSGDSSQQLLLRDPKFCYRTFAGYFRGEVRSDRVFDATFVQHAFDFAQIAKLKAMQAPVLPARGLLTLDPLDKESGHSLLSIRRGFRTMFLYLWSKDALILPMSFSTDTSISPYARTTLLTPVASFFWSPPVEAQQFRPCLERESKDATSRKHRMTRFITSTNFHTFGQVSITEISERFVEMIQSGDDVLVRTAHVFTGALCALNAYHQDKLSYNCGDVELYRQWTHASEFHRFTLEAFHRNRTKILTERKQTYSTRANEKARKDKLEREYGKEEADRMEVAIPTVASRLLAIANDRQMADPPLAYFEKLASQKRGYSKGNYVGREHIEVADLGKHWFEILDGFIDYRKSRGAESMSGVTSALSILCDYLFCYLPWWQELNPDAGFVLPETPADFTRERFVIGDRQQNGGPLTFVEAMKLRRRTVDGEGQVVTLLAAFFAYLKAYKSYYPKIAKRDIGQAFLTEFDYPRRRGPKPKTNKVPLPKKVMPFLLRYLYTLEQFGMHLQYTALRGGKRIPLHRQPLKLIPSEFGFTARFTFRNVTYTINEFPNLFPISKQSIRLPDGSEVTCHIPVLGGLRMAIAALETGLRLQSIQWLDLRTWDSLNSGVGSEEAVYRLLVNTDKTKSEAWATSIVARAYHLLARERDYQHSLATPNVSLIPYENLEHSRFGLINPLFRSTRPEGMPVDDSAYQGIWLKTQIGFEQFYNKQVSPNEWTPFTELGPRYLGGLVEKGNEIVERSGNVDYSPLRRRAIHTPHAARASFITHRISIMDIDDIARLVGHNNVLVTAHYVVEAPEEIAQKLMLGESQGWDYDPSNAVAIRADAENSALRRSLKKDREATARTFGFLSIRLLNERDENFVDGVALLKTTPQTEIVYRETHICPVGEACPAEVLEVIKEPRRCGLCPLAIKCVDHLTAIAAKIHQLKEQVLTLEALRVKRLAQQELAVVDELDDRRRLDMLELAGWLGVNSMLATKLEELKAQGRENETVFHVDMPDAVRLHLTHVTRKSSQAEFLLQRLVDSVNYPGLETNTLRDRANVLRRRLLTNAGRMEEALEEVPEGDEVTAVLSTLMIVAQAIGIAPHEVIAKLDAGHYGPSRASLLGIPTDSDRVADVGLLSAKTKK